MKDQTKKVFEFQYMKQNDLDHIHSVLVTATDAETALRSVKTDHTTLISAEHEEHVVFHGFAPRK